MLPALTNDRRFYTMVKMKHPTIKYSVTVVQLRKIKNLKQGIKSES